MNLQVTVLAADSDRETTWARMLSKLVARSEGVTIRASQDANELGQIVFVDAAMPKLRQTLQSLDRRGRAVFLLVPDGEDVPGELADGLVDDVLVSPPRMLEFV